MADLVYILCALTSGVCATLLLRSGRRAGAKLLQWSGWAFICFAAANVMLFVDLSLIPQVDLILLRNLATLAGIALLLYGLIWETT